MAEGLPDQNSLPYTHRANRQTPPPKQTPLQHKVVPCQHPTQRTAFLCIIPSCGNLRSGSVFGLCFWLGFNLHLGSGSVSILALFQHTCHDKAQAAGICSADRMGQCEISEGTFVCGAFPLVSYSVHN